MTEGPKEMKMAGHLKIDSSTIISPYIVTKVLYSVDQSSPRVFVATIVPG
jgi:hypothetical protein